MTIKRDETMLTRFEKARVLGARALQLSLGAPGFIETEEVDPIIIAQMEMERDLIPMAVQKRVEL